MSAAWFRIGVVEMAKNGKQPCEAAYGPLKRSVELNPDHAGARCGLGNVLLLVRKDYARAEEHLRASIELNPKLAPAHQGLARVLDLRGDLDGAIREMLAYVTLSGDPDGSGKAHAAALLEKKKKAGGRAAIRLDPNFAAHRSLAAVLEKRGDLDGAIRAMFEYVRVSGDPDGNGKAHAAALLEKKKNGGSAAKPDAEAQARFPPPLVALAPRLRATSCG